MQPQSRRARYRTETRDEAKRIALDQLADAGISGVSVNAIAKQMGVTGPALYRYFASRDDLLTALIGDAYHDLAEAMELAVSGGRKRKPEQRFREAAHALRRWALAAPHRYQLLFGTPVPGYHAPAEMVEAAHRTMAAFWEVVSVLPDPGPGRGAALDRQLVAWGRQRWGAALPPGQLCRAVLTWTRLHGVLSTELGGHLRSMGIDPELLFQAEIESLLSVTKSVN